VFAIGAEVEVLASKEDSDTDNRTAGTAERLELYLGAEAGQEDTAGKTTGILPNVGTTMGRIGIPSARGTSPLIFSHLFSFCFFYSVVHFSPHRYSSPTKCKYFFFQGWEKKVE
jgi:hypothetical protein